MVLDGRCLEPCHLGPSRTGLAEWHDPDCPNHTDEPREVEHRG